MYALYVLAITSGMRQGEILGLKWADVQLDQGVIQIRHTTQTIWKEGIVFSEPKTDKARRSVTIPELTITALREHKKNQDLIIANANKWTDYDLVFPTSVGTPISARNILRHFQTVKKKANLPDNMRFHDLRHTSATLLLLAGVHPKVVQERLGHSQISLTLDIYSHVIPSMQEEAADKMGEILA